MQPISTTNPRGATINQVSNQTADRQQLETHQQQSRSMLRRMDDKPIIIQKYATQTESQHQQLASETSIKDVEQAKIKKQEQDFHQLRPVCLKNVEQAKIKKHEQDFHQLRPVNRIIALQ